MAHVKKSCATLVLALIEDDSDDRTKTMSKELEETLDMKSVRTNMVNYFGLHQKMLKNKESWEVREDIFPLGFL